MDIYVHHYFYDDQKPPKKRVNTVREWLNLMYVSEISMMDGRSLILGIDSGKSIHRWYIQTKRERQNKPDPGDKVLVLTYGSKFYRSLLETRV